MSQLKGSRGESTDELLVRIPADAWELLDQVAQRGHGWSRAEWVAFVIGVIKLWYWGNQPGRY